MTSSRNSEKNSKRKVNEVMEQTPSKKNGIKVRNRSGHKTLEK